MIVESYVAGILCCIITFVTSYQIIRAGYFNLITGSQLGFSFFVGGSILISLLFDGIPASTTFQTPIETLLPEKDLNIYLICLLGSVVFSLLPYICFPLYKKIDTSNIDSVRMVKMMGVIYVIFGVAFFALSGKASGGHWMKSTANLLSTNPVAVVLGNFVEAFRAALPAALLLLKLTDKISNKWFICLLAMLAGFELVVTSDRITILYCIFAFFLANRRQLHKVVLLGIILSPPVLLFNTLFPAIRGMVFSHGASLQGTEDAFEGAVSQKHRVDPLKIMSAAAAEAFEAGDLTCFKYVVDNYPEKKDYLFGSTFLLKSVTFYIPKSLWPDKPNPFSETLGEDIIGNRSVALNSTLMGEAYANFGPLSWLILPLFLVWVQSAYNALRGGTLGNYVGLFVGIAMWRVDFSLCIIDFFCFACLIGLSKIRRAQQTGVRIDLIPSLPESA